MLNEIPLLWSQYQIEVDACNSYTKNIFTVFKELLKESTLDVIIEKEKKIFSMRLVSPNTLLFIIENLNHI
jgi:hypothetical protein